MFSKTTEYALRATIYIAQKGTIDNKLGIDEISKAIDSPKSFTAKVLQSLTRDNIVSSTRGPNGGFYFTSQAKRLPAISILKSVNDAGVLKKCILGSVSYTHLRAHETGRNLVCRLLLEKK